MSQNPFIGKPYKPIWGPHPTDPTRVVVDHEAFETLIAWGQEWEVVREFIQVVNKIRADYGLK